MARTAGKRQDPRGKLDKTQSTTRRPLPTVDDEKQQKMNPKVLLGIGGALVLVLFIVAVAIGLSNEVDPEDTMPQNVAVEFDGEVDVLPQHDPGAAVDPAVGMSAPAFSTVAFDETPVSLTHDGTPKVIVFLAHWCQHCQAEVPALQAYIDANGLPEGAELVSIATSIDQTRPNYPPSLWLEEEGWTPEVLVDDAASSISRAYGLSAFPYYVFLDGDGTVIGRVSGGQPPETVASVMESLAAEA